MKKCLVTLILLLVTGFYAQTGFISGQVRILDFWGSFWTGTVTVFSQEGEILGHIEIAPEGDSVTRFVNYKIEGLPIVECYVMAEVEGCLPQYYEHVYEVEVARPVYPDKPGVEDIDFDLERGVGSDGSGGVSGLVYSQEGPLSYCSVYAKKNGRLDNGTITCEEGTYTLHLEPGVYDIYATRPGYKTAWRENEATVAFETVYNVDIFLEPTTMEACESEMEFLDFSIDVFPNPFNLTAFVSFDLPNSGKTSVEVYDATGQLVATLVAGFRQAGCHQLYWDAKDARGNPLPSGVYLCRITQGNRSATRLLILTR
ncbi:T9SS type A sorting domain-containing protein [candidate division WOR-3 bacterium]|nr:T9SS type A sorting domain-containing protein [candidate division WOR-3 bacterium]